MTVMVAEASDPVHTSTVIRLGPHLPAHEGLLHRVRLMDLTGPARWEDPHWPGYRA
ncbi:hypothetical protein [Streptomyces sp. NPDC088757]|uniref:hypothetical protein n=1 Tax=Streptomyces sp. NPDC088757 TaxID=3365889 RepID=UPI00381097B1